MDAIHELLRRATIGLGHNPSVTVPHMLVYVHTLLRENLGLSEDGTQDGVGSGDLSMVGTKVKKKTGTSTWKVQRVENARRMKRRKHETARVLPEPKMAGSGRYINRRRNQKDRHSRAAPEMAWFALTLLHSLLKRKRVVPSKPRHRAMLDPFLDLLVRYVCVPLCV